GVHKRGDATWLSGTTAAFISKLNFKLNPTKMSCFRKSPVENVISDQVPCYTSADYPNTRLLDKKKHPDLSMVAIQPSISIDEVWLEVRALEHPKFASSRYRKVGKTIEPVIDFLTRFAPVVDMMVQGSSSASLIWGSLKAVLMVAQTSASYFRYIDNAMLKLNDTLSISSQYEKMFATERRVRTALLNLYDEIYLFLEKIRKAVSASSFKIFIKNVKKSFDMEFRDNLEHIERYTRVFNDEITLAHRARIDSSTKQIQEMVGVIALDNADMVNRADNRDSYDTKDAILKWLTQVDTREDYYRALSIHSPGTGVWIRDDPRFKNWRDCSKLSHGYSTLWVHGRPGFGKTVLSAVTIEHLEKISEEKKNCKVAYFYCDFGDTRKRTTVNILGSILAQLIMSMQQFPIEVYEAYHRAKKYGRQHFSTADDILSVIKHAVADIPLSYIVLDGIDECSDPTSITESFSDIAKNNSNVKLILFSRNLPTIAHGLERAPYEMIELEPTLTQPDIDKFLTKSLKKLQDKGTDAPDQAFCKLSNASCGMFLYASLGVQNLAEAIDSKSIVDAIDKIPEGLNGVYGQILERLDLQSIRRRNLARRILLWVCCTTRPLSWKELQYALSWDEINEEFMEDQLPFKDVVLDLCAPLIEYRPEKDTFHPVHLSVREFLYTPNSFNSMSAKATQFLMTESQAHQTIAEVTLASLALPDVVHKTSVDNLQYPLVRYSTENWCHHLSSASFDERLGQKHDSFVASPLARSTWILRFLVSNKQSYPLQRIAKYQKQVSDWKLQKERTKTTFAAEDLADIQRALIGLDQLDLGQAESVSNFERDLIVRDLARAFTMAGKVDQAIDLFEKALTEGLQGSPLPESVRTTWLLNSLGIMYDQKNLTDLALKTQMKALSIQEKSLPSNHLDLALTLNEMGRETRHLERYSESEQYHLRALDILRQSLPETDLQIIWTLNTLARCYRFQGRYPEALNLHQLALKGQITLMGEDHPHPLRTRSDIAKILKAEGKYKEALEIMEDIYERRVKVLGKDNPDTLWTMNDIGAVWEELGIHIGSVEGRKKAILWHERALELQERVLGKEHPHAVWSRRVLERLREGRNE
ncbi:a9bb4458-a7ff-4557-b5c9-8001b7ffca93, partial [Sclerotinia trifoliorum]